MSRKNIFEQAFLPLTLDIVISVDQLTISLLQVT